MIADLMMVPAKFVSVMREDQSVQYAAVDSAHAR